MRKETPWILAACALSVVFTAGCNKPVTNTANQQSAADKAKMEAASREANLKYRRAQIEQSKLPAAEKQRLLSQLPSSGN